MYLVKNGIVNSKIVIREDATETEISVANELQNYLQKISGALIPIMNEKEQDEGVCIYIGKTLKANKMGINTKGLRPEGFRIKTVAESIFLVGKDDAGISHAIHYFLEKYCGVRWFFPGELWEIVPKAKDVVVETIDDAEEPDFVWRAMLPLEEPSHETIVWMKRNRLGGPHFRGVHGFDSMLPVDKYGLTHPEYFAFRSGKRDTSKYAQLCTSNQEVVRICVEHLRKYFDENKDVDGVTISPNDRGGFCECPNCRALDTGDTYTADRPPFSVIDPLSGPSMTDRLFTFANQLAEGLVKTHPDKFLLMLVYWYYVKPPKKVKLKENVIAWYCVSCVGHWNPERRDVDFQRLRELKKFAENIAIYEYYLNQAWPDLYRIIPTLIAESLRRFHKEGVKYFSTQIGEGFATNGLNYYLASKLLWDTSLDEREILQDFYKKAFAEAAIPIRRFFETLEMAWREATIHGDLKGTEILLDARYLYDQLVRIFTPNLLQELETHLNEAENLAQDSLVKQRIAFLRKGLEYHKVTMRLVNAAKKVEALGLPEFTAKGPYPLDQAKSMISQMYMYIPESDKLKPALEDALKAWEEWDKFTTEMRGKQIFTYKIGSITRGKLRIQGQILRELLAVLPELP